MRVRVKWRFSSKGLYFLKGFSSKSCHLKHKNWELVVVRTQEGKSRTRLWREIKQRLTKCFAKYISVALNILRQPTQSKAVNACVCGTERATGGNSNI